MLRSWSWSWWWLSGTYYCWASIVCCNGWSSTTTVTSIRRRHVQILHHNILKHPRKGQFQTTTTTTTLRLIPNHYYLYKSCSSSSSSSCRYVGSTTILLSRSQQPNIEEEKQSTRTKKIRRTWEENLELLVSYKEKHGNCNVPTKYKEDRRLGTWVNSQRQQKEKGSLNDERIAKLTALGFSWSNEIFEDQWEVMFEKLVQYANENNGDCNIPYNDDDNEENKELYRWVSKQRLRKLLLSKGRRTKLENLGLIWEDANKVKADQKWNEKYKCLKEYKQKYDHCRVPQRWEEDPSLGRWVNIQRQKYGKGLLREDRQIQLEEIDFTWKVWDRNAPDVSKLDLKWMVKFGILLNFLEDHGHCDVPIHYKKDNSLGLWVFTQRRNKMKGDLRDDRKEQLHDIGFTWSFDDLKDAQWNEKYQELKLFKEQNGHLRLPVTSKSLINWVTDQRVQFVSGKVAMKRKARLDELGFQWKIHSKKT